jgi:hypothetical protein
MEIINIHTNALIWNALINHIKPYHYKNVITKKPISEDILVLRLVCKDLYTILKQKHEELIEYDKKYLYKFNGQCGVRCNECTDIFHMENPMCFRKRILCAICSGHKGITIFGSDFYMALTPIATKIPDNYFNCKGSCGAVQNQKNYVYTTCMCGIPI